MRGCDLLPDRDMRHRCPAPPARLTPALRRFIKSEYEQNPDDYAAAFDELSTMRDACVVAPPQVHETGVRAINRSARRAAIYIIII